MVMEKRGKIANYYQVLNVEQTIFYTLYLKKK
jgi:hypothetical protein